MDSKGRIFKGVSAGRSYDLLAPLCGMGKSFFTAAVRELVAEPGMKVLDLGCGTGKLIFALCGQSHEEASFYGCDYSVEQLEFAEQIKSQFPQKITFINASMDELDFPDGHFDIIMSSMALHAVNPQIRRQSIYEASRMLKNGGTLLLVDFGQPRPGLVSLLFSTLAGVSKKGVYDHKVVDGYCSEYGLDLLEENYLNSLVRRQVFIKKTSS